MRNVYEIHYEILSKTQGDRRGTWITTNDPIHILANGSIKGAIKKAESYLLGIRSPWTDENGRKKVEINVKVRITSCERIITLDA